MKKTKKEISIIRFKENPLLVPNSHVDWMKKNVFNPGVAISNGLWQMLFRASGADHQLMSSLGWAFSYDGIVWQILDKPVLRPGFNDYSNKGIEDPRIVKWIDGYYYVFATAYSDKGPRIGIWKTKNFSYFEWVGIPFDQDDKDASIFPEPIDGWAYLLHRKPNPPHIWISRTRDPTLKGNWQDTQVLIEKDEFYRHPLTGELPIKIGIAGPPLKTDKGWLVITHVVHQEGRNQVYSLGFMVLNLLNPTKIEYLHPSPILWPTEKYEMDGSMPMVCFSNAIVDPGGDDLYIFYGGADTVVGGGRLLKEDLPMCY